MKLRWQEKSDKPYLVDPTISVPDTTDRRRRALAQTGYLVIYICYQHMPIRLNQQFQNGEPQEYLIYFVKSLKLPSDIFDMAIKILQPGLSGNQDANGL